LKKFDVGDSKVDPAAIVEFTIGREIVDYPIR
jgi:hypothetical protein